MIFQYFRELGHGEERDSKSDLNLFRACTFFVQCGTEKLESVSFHQFLAFQSDVGGRDGSGAVHKDLVFLRTDLHSVRAGARHQFVR